MPRRAAPRGRLPGPPRHRRQVLGGGVGRRREPDPVGHPAGTPPASGRPPRSPRWAAWAAPPAVWRPPPARPGRSAARHCPMARRAAPASPSASARPGPTPSSNRPPEICCRAPHLTHHRRGGAHRRREHPGAQAQPGRDGRRRGQRGERRRGPQRVGDQQRVPAVLFELLHGGQPGAGVVAGHGDHCTRHTGRHHDIHRQDLARVCPPPVRGPTRTPGAVPSWTWPTPRCARPDTATAGVPGPLTPRKRLV